MSDLAEADVRKMKVAELKAELSSRDLSTIGNKPVLTSRLIDHLKEAEAAGEPAAAESVEEPSEPVAEAETAAEPEAETASEPEAEPAAEPVAKEEAPKEEAPKAEEPTEEATMAEEPAAETTEEQTTPADAKKSTESEAPLAAEVMEESQEENVVEAMEAEEPVKEQDSKAGEPATKEDEAPAAAEKDDKMETEAEKSETKEMPKATYNSLPSKTPSRTPNREAREPPAEVKCPEYEEGKVVLDFYNSDVFLLIEDEGMAGSNKVESGFNQLWTCGRTTHGVSSGKVCFGVQLRAKLECRTYENFGVEKHQFRVGVSSFSAFIVPGMDSASVAVDNFGKTFVGAKAITSEEDSKLKEKDVVVVAIDFDEHTVSFYRNGEQFVNKIELPENLHTEVLYPTIGTRNMPFTILTTATGEDAFTPEGFTWIQDLEDKVRGPLPPASREDCEVVMMIGFPSSGKTTHVRNLVKENPDRNYNILGTSYILKRMQDAVEARKKTKNGRMGYGMINHAENMLRIVFDLAGRRARNYIIDQHNCQAAAQRRKLSYFTGGYKRRAVAIVPTEELLKERTDGIPEEDKHEDLPKDLQFEMKAYLTIPAVPEQVSEVTYVDATTEEVAERVKGYNSEGQEWLKKNKRRSGGHGQRGGYHVSNRGGYNNYNNYRGGSGGGGKWNNNRDNRYQPYGGGYQGRGGYSSGGGRGGYSGGSRGGYRGGYGGGNGGGYGGGNRGGGYRGGYGSNNNNNRGGNYRGNNRW